MNFLPHDSEPRTSPFLLTTACIRLSKIIWRCRVVLSSLSYGFWCMQQPIIYMYRKLKWVSTNFRAWDTSADTSCILSVGCSCIRSARPCISDFPLLELSSLWLILGSQIHEIPEASTQSFKGQESCFGFNLVRHRNRRGTDIQQNLLRISQSQATVEAILSRWCT